MNRYQHENPREIVKNDFFSELEDKVLMPGIPKPMVYGGKCAIEFMRNSDVCTLNEISDRFEDAKSDSRIKPFHSGVVETAMADYIVANETGHMTPDEQLAMRIGFEHVVSEYAPEFVNVMDLQSEMRTYELGGSHAPKGPSVEDLFGPAEVKSVYTAADGKRDFDALFSN